MKNIIAVLLLLTLALSLCACGGQTGTETTTEPEITTTEPETTVEDVDDGMVDYKVTVVDEGGNPVGNIMLQLCDETCMPGMADANGVATFHCAENPNYHVTVMENMMPEGYDYATEETEFYFDDGKLEMTIVLKAIA